MPPAFLILPGQGFPRCELSFPSDWAPESRVVSPFWGGGRRPSGWGCPGDPGRGQSTHCCLLSVCPSSNSCVHGSQG